MTYLSQGFFDESGGLESKVFVLGGYVGDVEMWKRFSDDWRTVLHGKDDGLPTWPPFHAAPCESGKEGFEALDERDRKRRIGRLIQVIAKHKPQAVLCGVDVPRFKAGLMAAGHVKKRKESWSHPYSFAAHHLFGDLCILEEATGRSFGSIEPVFDTIDGDHRHKKSMEESVLAALGEDEPQLAKRLAHPRWLLAGERANCVPVQAADLLVWHYGRSRNSVDGTTRRAFRDLKNAAPFKFVAPRGAVDLQDLWIRGHMPDG